MRVSEHFFSVQGEGTSAGVPCLFVRFPGCNLECGGHNASLVRDGKATWWCDTEPVWAVSREATPGDILNALTPAQELALEEGRAHVVLTGGEPCIGMNTAAAIELLDEVRLTAWGERCRLPGGVFVEVETNGTLWSKLLAHRYVSQVNCSPKLSNSGMPALRRIRPEVLKAIEGYNELSQFKFVVSSRADVEEMLEDFVYGVGLSANRVVLMPAVDRRAEMAERTRLVWDLAVEYGLRLCSRLHVLAFDRVTGV